jgi:hypothetical protein
MAGQPRSLVERYARASTQEQEPDQTAIATEGPPSGGLLFSRWRFELIGLLSFDG